MNCVFKTLLVLSVSFVYVCTALICPAFDFNATDDASRLRRAFADEDDDVFINILTLRSLEQRLDIREAYHTLYGRYLTIDCELSLSGNFKNIIVAMLSTLPEYYAKEIYKDTWYFGIDSKAVLDIFTTSTNAFLKEVAEAYTDLYGEHSLAEAFQKDTWNLPYGVLWGQIQGVRDETQEVNEDVLIHDAEVIYQGGQVERISKEQAYWIRDIFIYRSFNHLRKLITKYKELYGNEIEKAFDNWGVDNIARGTKNMIDVLRSVPDYFARRLHEIMDGSGTNNRQLIRILVGRSEIDLDEINTAFVARYKKRLGAMIVDDTTGKYRLALLAIVNSEKGICYSQYC